jgi:hypothetical protein
MAESWDHPTWPGRGSTSDIAGRGSTLDTAGGSTPGHDRLWVHSRQRRVVALSALAGWLHSRLGEVWSHVAAIAVGPVFFSSGKFALLWRWLVWQVCPGSSDSSRPTTSRPGGPSSGRPLRVTVRTPSPKTGRPQRRLAKAGPTRRSGKGWSHPTVLAGWFRPTLREGWLHSRVAGWRVDPPDTSGGVVAPDGQRRWSRPRLREWWSHPTRPAGGHARRSAVVTPSVWPSRPATLGNGPVVTPSAKSHHRPGHTTVTVHKGRWWRSGLSGLCRRLENGGRRPRPLLRDCP